jgi:ribosome-binding factor A
MKNGDIRDLQLATLIAEELESALYTAHDQRLSELTITRVEPAKGGRHFIIYVVPEEESSSFRSADDIKYLLARASKYLRSALAAAMNLKRTPELTFMLDPLYSFGGFGEIT